MRDVLAAVTASLRAGREVLLCQVVETKGSTPQKAGAAMVVRPEGGQVGTLGGGCVENEVRLKCLRMAGRDGAELHTFVLDHDYAWADGLICGGKMAILASAYRGPEAARFFSEYERLLDAGEGLTEAIVIDEARAGFGPIGGRFLFDPEGRQLAGLPGSTGDPGPAAPLSGRPKAACRQGVAWLPTLPIRLVIIGAGHVGQAVADLAARTDFDVWAVDDRAQYANVERFPSAAHIVVGPLDRVLPSLEITKNTYVLIVTRGHGHDQEALYHMAGTAAPYVGLIGSRRKVRMIFDGLRDLGVSEDALRRVSAPVGLDIGSQSVAEIAVSIVAELISRRNLGPATGHVSKEGTGYVPAHEEATT